MARTLGIPALALLSLTLAPACSSSNPAPPVPVAGVRSDISALAGRWEGEYSSEATGRSGSITFELKAGDTVARGDVLMVPKGASQPPPASSLPGTSSTLATMPQVLNISFVNASGGVVKGTMQPYRDPECDCEVETTFIGRLTGGTIEGTFTSSARGASTVTTGRWKMTRQTK
jgi:hypothetical protein